MLAKFEVMLKSNASKHLEMKNAGWMGWVASFCGPASIGCAEMLAVKPASILPQKMLCQFSRERFSAGFCALQVFVACRMYPTTKAFEEAQNCF